MFLHILTKMRQNEMKLEKDKEEEKEYERGKQVK